MSIQVCGTISWNEEASLHLEFSSCQSKTKPKQTKTKQNTKHSETKSFKKHACFQPLCIPVCLPPPPPSPPIFRWFGRLRRSNIVNMKIIRFGPHTCMDNLKYNQAIFFAFLVTCIWEQIILCAEPQMRKNCLREVLCIFVYHTRCLCVSNIRSSLAASVPLMKQFHTLLHFFLLLSFLTLNLLYYC